MMITDYELDLVLTELGKFGIKNRKPNNFSYNGFDELRRFARDCDFEIAKLREKHAKATEHIRNLKKEVERLKYREANISQIKEEKNEIKNTGIMIIDLRQSVYDAMQFLKEQNEKWEKEIGESRDFRDKQTRKIIKLQDKRNNTAKKLWALRGQVKSLKEESQKNREEIKEELKNEFLEKISWGIGQVFKMGVDYGSDEKKIEDMQKTIDLYKRMDAVNIKIYRKVRGKHERATRHIAELKEYNKLLDALNDKHYNDIKQLLTENEKLKKYLKKIKSMSHHSNSPKFSLSEIWLFIDKIL